MNADKKHFECVRDMRRSPVSVLADEEKCGHKGRKNVDGQGVQIGTVERVPELGDALIEDHDEKQAEILLHTQSVPSC